MTQRGPIIPSGLEQNYEQWHFAPAFRVGNTIHVSGVIGSGPDGRVPENAAAEFEYAFNQLATTIAAAGATMADIVEMTTYHVDMAATLPAFMAARDAAMSEPWPAWTAIGCTELALPGGRAEVKVTVVVDE